MTSPDKSRIKVSAESCTTPQGTIRAALTLGTMAGPDHHPIRKTRAAPEGATRNSPQLATSSPSIR
jgi:hypothetical protein